MSLVSELATASVLFTTSSVTVASAERCLADNNKDISQVWHFARELAPRFIALLATENEAAKQLDTDHLLHKFRVTET
jgi:hypothetical protein